MRGLALGGGGMERDGDGMDGGADVSDCVSAYVVVQQRYASGVSRPRAWDLGSVGVLRGAESSYVPTGDGLEWDVDMGGEPCPRARAAASLVGSPGSGRSSVPTGSGISRHWATDLGSMGVLRGADSSSVPSGDGPESDVDMGGEPCHRARASLMSADRFGGQRSGGPVVAGNPPDLDGSLWLEASEALRPPHAAVRGFNPHDPGVECYAPEGSLRGARWKAVVGMQPSVERVQPVRQSRRRLAAGRVRCMDLGGGDASPRSEP